MAVSLSGRKLTIAPWADSKKISLLTKSTYSRTSPTRILSSTITILWIRRAPKCTSLWSIVREAILGLYSWTCRRKANYWMRKECGGYFSSLSPPWITATEKRSYTGISSLPISSSTAPRITSKSEISGWADNSANTPNTPRLMWVPLTICHLSRWAQTNITKNPTFGLSVAYSMSYVPYIAHSRPQISSN